MNDYYCAKHIVASSKSVDDVKLKLIEEKIYVPTLWPGVLDFNNLTQFERNLVDNLVLLPIDQRYDIEDMEYIVKVVMKHIM